MEHSVQARFCRLYLVSCANTELFLNLLFDKNDCLYCFAAQARDSTARSRLGRTAVDLSFPSQQDGLRQDDQSYGLQSVCALVTVGMLEPCSALCITASASHSL